MTQIDGDTQLGEHLRRYLGSRHPIAAVATVSAEGRRAATIGTSIESNFEMGSVSKGITGLLWADACSRGELGPDTRLVELLPLGDSEVGQLTLAALSTHRSGLPRLPAGMHPLWRTLRLVVTGASPYGETVDEMLGQARRTRPRSRGALYSNLGFELLGHATARGADRTYQELLRDRLTVPLGLENTYAPHTLGELRQGALVGRSRLGREGRPWVGEAIAPAGGVRASITDAGRLASALLDGSAPGMSALDPVAELTGSVGIGAGWLVMEVDGRVVTWHNGGTGGFRSWFGLDRAAGTAVVVVSATAVSVDEPGIAMLRDLTDTSRPGRPSG